MHHKVFHHHFLHLRYLVLNSYSMYLLLQQRLFDLLLFPLRQVLYLLPHFVLLPLQLLSFYLLRSKLQTPLQPHNLLFLLQSFDLLHPYLSNLLLFLKHLQTYHPQYQLLCQETQGIHSLHYYLPL